MNKYQMTENLLTRKPSANALNSTLFLVLLLLASSYAYLFGLFRADEWMGASGVLVFEKHQYWRAWSTLFAHGDFGHIISNLFLFMPFSYFLSGYFGYFFFPFIGFFVGGLVNLLVIKTMPDQVGLIGVSGVVYWMGAAWMTLSFLIDRRETTGKRMVKIIGISAILFIPDSFKAEVSYMSHFLGYVAGVITAGLYFMLFKKRIRGADHFEEILPEPEPDDQSVDEGQCSTLSLCDLER